MKQTMTNDEDSGICCACCLSQISLDDKYGKVAFCLLPYLEPAVARQAFKDSELKDHEQAMAAALKRFSIASSERSVVIAHAFVTGGLESDSERALTVGGSSQVAAELFAPYDFTALGHLHRRQSFLGGKVHYSGSLLKYSFSEVQHEKSVSLVSLDAKGKASIEHIALEKRRDLRVLQGDFFELVKDPATGSVTRDYLLVELSNTEPVLDAASRLREIYPNLLHVRRPQLEFAADSAEKLDANKLDDLSILDSFYSHVLNEELSEQQIEYLQSALNERLSEDVV